jgi:hypothetical protein
MDPNGRRQVEEDGVAIDEEYGSPTRAAFSWIVRGGASRELPMGYWLGRELARVHTFTYT